MHSLPNVFSLIQSAEIAQWSLDTSLWTPYILIGICTVVTAVIVSSLFGDPAVPFVAVLTQAQLNTEKFGAAF
jgi:hypothetical protein